MMPSDPTPHLVLIHADFAFTLFKNGFYRPSHAADPNELRAGRADRRIAEIVFDFGGILQIAANDQPELTAGKPRRDSLRAERQNHKRGDPCCLL